MKQKLYQKIRLMLAVIALLVSANVHAEIASGTCGADVRWTLSDDGTLTISGTGAMNDGYYGWSGYSERVSKVVIEDGVTNVGSSAFYKYKNLTSVTIGNTVETIGKYAFLECGALTSVFIPNSVTSIDSYAFQGCTDIASLTIGDHTRIGDYAFRYCYVKELTYAEGTKTAFQAGFKTITSVVIPSSVTSIGELAFDGCTKLTSITIPNSVTSIDGWAFRNCTSLTSVIIPNSVINIGESTFSGCKSLASVSIPNSVTSIGESAFVDCNVLTSINIPNSVTSIGFHTFLRCYNLTSITIPNSVTSIESCAFEDCTGLKSVTIPNSITSIGYGAFAYCYSLESINIPNSVTKIDSRTFYYCSHLKTFIIPNSVTSIGADAFYNCLSLASIQIPSSVTNIGNEVFYNCSKLTSVTIPNSVTNIGDRVFYGCTSLTELICDRKKMPAIGSDAFLKSNAENGTLYVPAESVNLYSVAYPWYVWGEIKSIEERKPEGGGENACQKPTIAYANGKLSINSDTPGAKCYYTIKDKDIAEDKYTSGEIALSATYQISAYAVAEGYNQSATATATLIWLDARLEGGTTNAKEISVPSVPLLITQDNGMVTASGLQDGQLISVYDTTGKQIATAKAIGDAALLDLSEMQGKVAILNVAGRSAKVMIK